MSRAPVVSVLMTSHNRERLIGESMASVLASSFTDFELLVVDDCSTDGTCDVVAKIAASDPRVRLHRNQRNLGDYPNRNQAAALARGKYLKYVDSDDCLYPHGLEIMVRSMENHPSAAYGVSSTPGRTSPFPVLLGPAEAYRAHYIEGQPIFSRAPLSAIIRRDAFEGAGGFSSTRMAGDFEMWHRLSFDHAVLLLPDGLTWYRSHDSQEVNDWARRPWIYRPAYESVIVHSVLEMRRRGAFSVAEAKRILDRVTRDHFKDVIRLALRGSVRLAAQTLVSGLDLRREIARSITSPNEDSSAVTHAIHR